MPDTKTKMGRQLAERLAKYAGEVLRLVEALPKHKPGRHVSDQLTRSATAPGAHYAEARSAQSAADFIHKLALSAKEARESQHWLRTSLYAGYTTEDVTWLVSEGGEITAILTASLQTARQNRDRRR